MRTLGIFLALFGLMVFSPNAGAEEKTAHVDSSSSPRSYVYGTFFYHSERRDYERERHTDFFVGYDRLLNPETNLWMGARVGFYTEQVLTSIPVGVDQKRPAIGFHVYKLLPIESGLSFRLGGGADLLYAGSSFDFPLWLYTGGEAGFRYNITNNVYAEIPVEIGFFPFFDGTPWFTKIGFQLGLGF